MESGTRKQVAQATAKVTVLGCSQPRTRGLSSRSTAMSRSRSATSFSQPAVARPTATVTDEPDLPCRAPGESGGSGHPEGDGEGQRGVRGEHEGDHGAGVPAQLHP